MAETTDGKVMQEDDKQTPAGGEATDHRSRGRRREGSSGKLHGHATQPADAAGSGPVGTLSGVIGDIQLSDAQIAAVEAAVQQKLADEQAKTEAAVERLARTQADFANYKRRNEQEREQQARYATLTLVQELLPVLDNLDRALATVPESVSGLPWMDGLLLVDRQLRATLEKQGLQPIVAVGQHFNPELHEAIIQEESTEHEDDEIIAELRRGYVLNDRVVRPSLVKVAKRVEPSVMSAEEK